MQERGNKRNFQALEFRSVSKMIIKTKKPYQDRDWLEHRYTTLRKNGKEIAQKFNITGGAIYYWLRQLGIKRRLPAEAIFLAKGKHVDLSPEALEFLSGELLGDGHLTSYNRQASAFTYTTKHEQYLRWLSNELAGFGLEQRGKINVYPRISSYASRSYIELKTLHTKWYIANPWPGDRPMHIKIIPVDLKLTPLVCRQWYIGDGTFCKKWKYITLCTQGFLKGDNTFNRHDIDSLVSKLLMIGVKSTRHRDGAIQVSVKSTKDFLSYIGPCPRAIQNVYGYKWPLVK